jgi:long-chain acyl-CoA synthetase
VGIALRNYPEWISAFMGITSAGAIAVAMNVWWSGEELVYGIEDSGLDLLFVDRERRERVAPFLDRLGETLAAVVMSKPGAEIDADAVKTHVAECLARF